MDSKRLLHLDKIPKDEELQKLFKGRSNSEVLFCGHRASYMISDLYSDFQRTVENFLNRKSVNALTLARFDRLWMRNILANFDILLQAMPVKQLFEQNNSQNNSHGKMALVCGAGPSLLYDMDRIQALRKKLILIAVDTALKPLVKHGIDPDIVLCVDPQALSRHYLRGYEGRAVFVVDPATSYLSLRQLKPENVFYFWSPFALAELLFEFLDLDPGKLAFGGSVSTNAYDLAFCMGCNPILLTGHDLAFTEGLAHVRGAALEELILHKQDRLFSNELHNHRQLKALPLRYLEADSAEKLRQLATNDKLIIFHQWFSRRLQSDLEKGKQIAKLSARGTRLGQLSAWTNIAEDQNLRDISFCLPSHPIRSEKSNSCALGSLYKNFALELKSLSQDFAVYTVKVKKGLELAQKIYELTRQTQTKDYLRILPEMEKIDKEIMQAQRVSALASHILQGLISQIKSKWESPHHEVQSSEQDLAKASIDLYSGLLEASEIYQKGLGRSAKFFLSRDIALGVQKNIPPSLNS